MLRMSITTNVYVADKELKLYSVELVEFDDSNSDPFKLATKKSKLLVFYTEEECCRYVNYVGNMFSEIGIYIDVIRKTEQVSDDVYASLICRRSHQNEFI